MMKENKHLTSEGLKQIKKIKAGINRGRKCGGKCAGPVSCRDLFSTKPVSARDWK